MKLEAPYLKTSDYFWSDYTRLWRNFTDKYNDQDDLACSTNLKAAHMNVYYRLIHFAARSIRKNNKELKDMPQLAYVESTQWLLIKGARKQLIARILHTSPGSVKRHLNRLEEANIITTCPNDFMRLIGREKRWNEILLNPDFLLIYDYGNSEYIPTSPYLDETEKQGFQKEKNANCRGVSSVSTLLDSKRNEIRDVDNSQIIPTTYSTDQVNRQVPLLDSTPSKKPMENARENARKKENFEPAPEKIPNRVDKPAIHGVLRSKYSKATQDLAALRRGLAVDLYIFMIQFLFTKHNIFPEERAGAIEYLETVYFSTVTDSEHGKFLSERYKWRVNAAKRHIDRHKWDFSNWYPQKYLNVSNKKGFANTLNWIKRSEGEHQERFRKRLATYKSLKDGEVLQKAVNNYKAAPTSANFVRKTEDLKNTYPHLLPEFIKRIQVMELV